MQSKSRLWIAISALALLVISGWHVGMHYYLIAGESTLHLQNKNYAVMTEMYALYPTTKARVVMLSDSHIYGADWSELMSDNGIVNRGIRGDIVGGMYARIASVMKLHPEMVCIMGGINDIYANVPPKHIAMWYEKVIDALQDSGINVVIVSTLCVSPSYKSHITTPADANEKVYELNQLLMELSTEKQCKFLDLNIMLCKDGFLADSLTYDGLHLNASGYALWRQLLQSNQLF
jgi:lysophospholipase L1-like esterase